MTALRLLLEGNLNKKEIAGKLNIDVSTLHRWEQEPDFKMQMERCINAVRESITKNITILAERLIESISKTAAELPPKESLELLLKILDKGEKLGLSFPASSEKTDKYDMENLTDVELRGKIRRYLEENSDD